MDSLGAIVADLIDNLDVELQEKRTRVELAPEVLADLRAAASGRPSRRAAAAPDAGAAPAQQPSDSAAAPAPAAPPPAAAVDPADDSLDRIVGEVAACQRCQLHALRTNPVTGTGPLQPDVMFIGEAPGADEDQQGIPFVGRAGQLLGKMIEAMGYDREEVFITNIVKCRPPKNRNPEAFEVEACLPFLKRQIALVKPKTIVLMGGIGIQALLGTKGPVGSVRGRWTTFENIPVMPTFHPAYLIRMPTAKVAAWADLRLVLKHLGRTPPSRNQSPEQ